LKAEQFDSATGVERHTTGWIWLGVYSLLAAGLLSLVLAFARTPLIQDILPGRDFFRVALVVHVDLSVLVWFMACAGLVWTLFGRRGQSLWNSAALALAVLGAVMLSVAPFVGAGEPLMNNYVPVLQDNWFFVGLAAVAGGLVMQAASYLRGVRISFSDPGFDDMVRFALVLAAISALMAVASVAVSYLGMPTEIQAGPKGKTYFEVLFWGGGHVLQFTNTVLVLVAWVMLARGCDNRLPLHPKAGMVLFALVAAPLVVVPWLYRFPVASGESITGFTALMRWGGLASIPLGLVLLVSVFRPGVTDQNTQPLRAVLLCSLTLFASGGLLGFMIKGSNTMIPAHYHGSIVGVTLAFMGVVYLVLPRLGFTISRVRMMYWQPYVYGGGQLLHITGLANSGGYGVQRKVAGAAQGLDGFSEILGMGMMGLGGLLSAVGGLMFLIVAISALRGGLQLTAPAPKWSTS
jgi:hypothetical protein